jgi:hypothetical protein
LVNSKRARRSKKPKEPPPITSWAQVKLKAGVISEFGARGEGKSVLGWFLADKQHKRGRHVTAFMCSTAARRLLPKWVNHKNNLEGLAKLRNHVIVVDEAAIKAAARQHATEENQIWGALIAVCRQKEHLLIFIAQHTRQVDINIVGDSDYVIFKKPMKIHIPFARREVRDLVEEAYNELEKKGSQSVKYSRVYNCRTGAKGMLKNGKPKFWSEELSKSFAMLDLEQLMRKGGPKERAARRKKGIRQTK